MGSLSGTFFSSLAFAHPLVGTWVRACNSGKRDLEVISAPAADQDGSRHLNAALSETFHRGRDCAIPAFTLRSRGEITLSSDAETHLDFVFESVDLALHEEAAIARANRDRLCGLENWQIHEPREITGLRCDLFSLGSSLQIPEKGRAVFGIYRIAPDAPAEHLYFGRLTAQENGRLPATRPTSFDPRFFTRSESRPAD